MEADMGIEAFAEQGQFAPGRIATILRTTKDEIAHTVGLGRDALMRPDRIASPKTQKRLREMVEILNRVEPRFDFTFWFNCRFKVGNCTDYCVCILYPCKY